jgi:hypothetical protein
VYKKALATTDSWLQVLDAAIGLGAIALRHAGSAAEVRRFLGSFEAPPPGRLGMDAARAWAAQSVLGTLEHVEEREEATLTIGRECCVEYGARLRAGHALRFDRPEDVPDALARTAALSLDADTWNARMRNLVFVVLPVAARASAEDFFFPREVVRAWFGAYRPEETVERLLRLTRNDARKEPVRVAKTPGRNEPCSCGSGKKWKRCHGWGG